MSTQAKKVQLKYGNLLGNSNFRAALQKLLNTPMDMKLAYSVKRVFDKLDMSNRAIRADLVEFRKGAAEKYGKKDAEGKIIIPEGSEGSGESMTFIPAEEHFEAMMDAEKEFASRIYELDYFQIPFTALGDAKFSPIELVALEGVVDFDGIASTDLDKIVDNVTELKKA